MGTRDPRVDAYIDQSAAFAGPILDHLRDLVHRACPDVEETIKWGAPTFMYHGIMCNMAAFKEHVGFGFWKGALVTGGADRGDTESAGQFGRIQSIEDLPGRTKLVDYVKEAARLNKAGITKAKKIQEPRPDAEAPAELIIALKKNRKTFAAYEAFSPSMRREYIEWIAEAKTDPTRDKRIAQAVEWISEGKSRNWKYGKAAS